MVVLKDIKFVKGKRAEPYEYYCKGCKQLRLAFVTVDKCSNCGNANIVKGKIGSLNKE